MRSASPEVADGPRAAISTGSNAPRMAIGLPTNLWRAEMRRREFIAGLGAAAWPLAARAQNAERARLVGILLPLVSDDPRAREEVSGFVTSLQQMGWVEGRNVRF